MADTVFIVDDDEGMRTSIARLLDRFGYRTTSFASAEEFLAAAIDSAPACFLFDVKLPGQSGIDLYRKVSHDGHPVPVIFITGSDSDIVRDAAMAANCFDYLTKPIAAETLLNAVERACRSAA